MELTKKITSNLKSPLANARASAFQSFASSADAAAVNTASQVPQAIGVGFGYTIQDLRTIGNGQWAASAPMEAALIYFVCSLHCIMRGPRTGRPRLTNDKIIFAFFLVLFMAQNRMQTGLQSKLKFKSVLALRVFMPIMTYFFLVCLYPSSLVTTDFMRCGADGKSHYGSQLSRPSGKFQCKITLVEVRLFSLAPSP